MSLSSYAADLKIPPSRYLGCTAFLSLLYFSFNFPFNFFRLFPSFFFLLSKMSAQWKYISMYSSCWRVRCFGSPWVHSTMLLFRTSLYVSIGHYAFPSLAFVHVLFLYYEGNNRVLVLNKSLFIRPRSTYSTHVAPFLNVWRPSLLGWRPSLVVTRASL